MINHTATFCQAILELFGYGMNSINLLVYIRIQNNVGNIG